MDGNVSLKKVASIVGAIVSFLAIISFYVPFATLSMDFGDLMIGGKEYAVFEMYQNGTGKVIAIFGTFLLLANSILQFLKPKAWLNLLSAAFLFIHVLLTSSGDVQFIHKEIGWWLCLIFAFLLTIAWGIGYGYYVRSMKNVGRMAIWGGSLTIVALLAPFALSFMTVPSLVVLLPVGLCLLLTSLLGRFFSSAKVLNLLQTEIDDRSENGQVVNQPMWKKYLWTIVCVSAFIMAIAVFMICFSGDNMNRKQKLEAIESQMKSIGEGEDKDIVENGSDMTSEETEKYEDVEAAVEDDWDATTSVDWEGTINGKWKIEMTVHRLDGMVWGSYCYTKNKTSIPLDGQWGENYQLTLTESMDGNITGNFIGTYTDKSFYGTWVSADGEKEYPFTLKPVYKVEP